MSLLDEKRLGLVELSNELGAEHRHLSILGEGNTSTRLDAETFLVKASGSSLGTLGPNDLVEARFAPLLELMKRSEVDPDEIEEVLFGSRVDPQAKKPSIEALFHAWLLSLPGVDWVGHTHPVAVNSILCSPRAEEFGARRIFPDEVVCCGSSSVFVDYCDPGLKLSQGIEQQTTRWMRDNRTTPRVILLRNHGIITIGSSAGAVKTAMYMAVKAAGIFVGAAALGGPVFLTEEQIVSVAGRRDEHYRQKALNL
jgi:rhamnose utilization protein RhaD (predicted bifunctional aldolase and dehydrogenase)